MKRRNFLLAGIVATGWAVTAHGASPGVATPDVIYVNGNIYTGEPGRFVHALAVHDGRVLAVGTEEEMRSLAGSETRFEDLRGHHVIPGFYDGHVHVTSRLSAMSDGIDLADVASLADLQERLRAFAATKPPSGWIRGTLPHGTGGKEVFSEDALPTHRDLDVVTEYPVVLMRGHVIFLNSKALEIAGITRATPHPPGGRIDLDASGAPTGALRENAAWRLVMSKYPPPLAESDEVVKAGLRDRLKFQLSLGVTSINVPGIEAPEDLRLLQELYAREGDSLPRLTIQIRLTPGYDRNDDLEKGIAASIEQINKFSLHTGFGNNRIKLGAIKMSVDGAFSGQAAWLIDSYPGRPGYHGEIRIPPDALYRVSKHAYDRGWQLGVHAIGDEAVRQTVDVFERIMKENPRPDPRLYVHHVSVKPPEDTLRKMKDLNIIACMQPNFTVTMAQYYKELLESSKVQTNNPQASLWSKGIRMSMGSDDLPSGPLMGLYGAVTRKGIDGQVYGRAERLTMAQAIHNATAGTAYMTFDESERGLLKPGMLADMTVLPADLFTIDPERLRTMKPVQTIIGGKAAFTASEDGVSQN